MKHSSSYQNGEGGSGDSVNVDQQSPGTLRVGSRKQRVSITQAQPPEQPSIRLCSLGPIHVTWAFEADPFKVENKICSDEG